MAKKNMEITFNSNTGNPAREKATQIICENLKQIGIKFQNVPVDFPSLTKLVGETFEYEAAMMGFGGGHEAAGKVNIAELEQGF